MLCLQKDLGVEASAHKHHYFITIAGALGGSRLFKVLVMSCFQKWSNFDVQHSVPFSLSLC